MIGKLKKQRSLGSKKYPMYTPKSLCTWDRVNINVISYSEGSENEQVG